MSDILTELRKVHRLRGDTYSSAEVIGMVGRAADEIEMLRDERDLWKSRCYAALWLVPDEKTKALLDNEQSTVTGPPDDYTDQLKRAAFGVFGNGQSGDK